MDRQVARISEAFNLRVIRRSVAKQPFPISLFFASFFIDQGRTANNTSGKLRFVDETNEFLAISPLGWP